jgi:hypothetical protein
MNGVGARLQNSRSCVGSAKVGLEARWAGAITGSALLPIVVQIVHRPLGRGTQHDPYESAISCVPMSRAAS